MPRARNAVATRRRHKKIVKLAKGYWGAKSKLYRVANQQVMRSLLYAYRDRRARKRDFRRLWVTRINAAARLNGISYNRFIEGLRKAGVEINRKMLAELAISNETAFAELAKLAKNQLSK